MTLDEFIEQETAIRDRCSLRGIIPVYLRRTRKGKFGEEEEKCFDLSIDLEDHPEGGASIVAVRKAPSYD